MSKYKSSLKADINPEFLQTLSNVNQLLLSLPRSWRLSLWGHFLSWEIAPTALVCLLSYVLPASEQEPIPKFLCWNSVIIWLMASSLGKPLTSSAHTRPSSFCAPSHRPFFSPKVLLCVGPLYPSLPSATCFILLPRRLSLALLFQLQRPHLQFYLSAWFHLCSCVWILTIFARTPKHRLGLFPLKTKKGGGDVGII